MIICGRGERGGREGEGEGEGERRRGGREREKAEGVGREGDSNDIGICGTHCVGGVVTWDDVDVAILVPVDGQLSSITGTGKVRLNVL